MAINLQRTNTNKMNQINILLETETSLKLKPIKLLFDKTNMIKSNIILRDQCDLKTVQVYPDFSEGLF